MQECRSSLARCLRAISIDSFPATQVTVPRPAFVTNRHRLTRQTARSHTTAVAREKDYGFQRESWRGPRGAERVNEPTATQHSIYKSQRGQKDERAQADTSEISPQDERNLRQELKYLRDPLKLAGHVRETLRANDYDKAVALCRLASRDMQCIVSWNHCIDWLMARKETRKAMKLYNEMKKRAQFPDSHTIILLLRGLAIPPIQADAVALALPLYHGLSGPNSRVRPGIIHTNATLQVCALAHDMDALWGVASRIPDTGPASADKRTFTTILNAIREKALLDSGAHVNQDEAAARREQAILEGRRIWEDIIGKWRSGNLIVDEELVCTMGRLLLIGVRPRDWDDILSLLEQTMNLPRMVAKIGTEERNAEHVPGGRLRLPNTPDSYKTEDSNEEVEFQRGGEFDSKPSRRGRAADIEFARPSNNTLSLVVEACLKMVTRRVASEYWELLTSPAPDGFGIQPDLDNYHNYLRLLRQQRAAAKTVECLRQLVSEKSGITPRRATFRIAMSVCVRDKNNHNVIHHAAQMLDMSEKHLANTDAKTLSSYMDIALYTQDGPTIVNAFHRVADGVRNLRSQQAFGATSEYTRPDHEDTVTFFRTLIGTIDTLMTQQMVPRDEFSTWSQRRSKLAAWVTRQKNNKDKAAEKVDGTEMVSSRSVAGAFGKQSQTLLERRRESRQLRHLRQRNKEREKRGEPTKQPDREDWKAAWVPTQFKSITPAAPGLADLPADVV